MAVIVFDGKRFALKRERMLERRIEKLRVSPKLVSLYFAEDSGSVIYTNLKQAAAKRVGIEFHAEKVSIKDQASSIIRLIKQFASDPGVQGLMIQKPAQKFFYEVSDKGWAGPGMISTLFKNLKYLLLLEEKGKGTDVWWRRLVAEISPRKDVDCLNPVNLDLVYRGRWKVLPATVRAVLSIIEVAVTRPVLVARTGLVGRSAVVVGRSEIVGRPLAHVLAQKGAKVLLSGSTGVVAESRGSQLIEEHRPLNLAEVTKEADIVVSATGEPGIITGDMVKKGVVVIDVGAPDGDVDFDSVERKASFITPVPGGVGPVTVVSLLENLMDIVED